MPQTERLRKQHFESHGVVGIFGEVAKNHDKLVGVLSMEVFGLLKQAYPMLNFRFRKEITKKEINDKLHSICPDLGVVLFVEESRIIPDGGIIEVLDDNNVWRIVLVSEAKHQGKDIENIEKGIFVGKDRNQDLMAAGNAIERAFKNVEEFANYMLMEKYFPYVLFLEGSNFLTENVIVKRPDGRSIELDCHTGITNRIDRLTAANYGMRLNQNLCINKFVHQNGETVMLQAPSLYTQGDGRPWEMKKMRDIMFEIAKTSLRVLAGDLFNQLSK